MTISLSKGLIVCKNTVERAFNNGSVTWRGHKINSFIIVKKRDIQHWNSLSVLEIQVFVNGNLLSTKEEEIINKVGDIQIEEYQSALFGRPNFKRVMVGDFDGIDDIIGYETKKRKFQLHKVVGINISNWSDRPEGYHFVCQKELRPYTGKFNKLPVFIEENTSLTTKEYVK